MAFQTKDFISIVAGMVNHMRAATSRITDFRIGSAARTLIEGPAVEIDELYQQFLNGVVEAIPAALYLSFNFERLPASAATGVVQFILSAPVGVAVVIPAGTQVGTADGLKTYESLAAVTIAPGFVTGSASVRATGVGAAFNAGAGDIVSVASAPSGVSVMNVAPITSGRDLETDDERRLRFVEFIASLSRGPLASVEFGARQAALTDLAGVVTERVAEARAAELFRVSGTRPLGFVNVYIYNGGSGASSGLVARAQQILDGDSTTVGFKAAGVVCTVAAATLRSVPLDVTVRMIGNELTAAQSAALTAELAAAIASTAIGAPLYLAALASAAFRVQGVLNFRTTNLLADLVPDLGQKLVIGAVVYTVDVS